MRAATLAEFRSGPGPRGLRVSPSKNLLAPSDVDRGQQAFLACLLLRRRRVNRTRARQAPAGALSRISRQHRIGVNQMRGLHWPSTSASTPCSSKRPSVSRARQRKLRSLLEWTMRGPPGRMDLHTGSVQGVGRIVAGKLRRSISSTRRPIPAQLAGADGAGHAGSRELWAGLCRFRQSWPPIVGGTQASNPI